MAAHNVNMPMHYMAILSAVKIDNFSMKKFNICLLLLKT